MASTTPQHSLPYPELSDPADVPTYMQDLAEAIDPLLTPLPPGTLIDFAGTGTVPDGWLACDGAAVSRTTYAALFTSVGTAFGPGNGTTTFNLPDFRARVAVPEDGAAGRMTANDTRGQTGGTEKHTLTVGEMPSHSHRNQAVDENQNNAPAAPIRRNWLAGGAYATGDEPVGGGASHNNMPPYVVIAARLIKT